MATRTRSAGWAKDAFDFGGASTAALLILFGLNMVDEFDRIAFATLTPEIRDAFHLTDAGIVAVGAVSAIFVLFAAVPVGYLADRVPRVKLARIAAVVWGSMAVLTGLAPAVAVLFAARFFSGFARSSNDIVHTGLLADYYKPEVHPKVFQVHRLANPFAQISALLAGAIGALLGWRWAFVLLAIPTFGLLSAAFKLREPHRGQSINAEAALAASEHAVPGFWETRRRLFAIRSLRRLWLAFFVIGVSFLALGQMFSLFYEKVYGFGPFSRGSVSFTHGVGQVIGIVLAGAIGTRAVKTQGYAAVTRYLGLSFGVFASGIALMAVAPWWPLSLLFGTIGVGALGFATPLLFAVLVRVIPPAIRSQGQSYGTVFLGIGGIFAIPLAGLGDHVGYRPALVVLSAILVPAAIILRSSARFVDEDVERIDREFAEVVK